MTDTEADAEFALTEALRQRPRHAAFVVELKAAVADEARSDDEFERALGDLEDDGRLLVSTHSFSDPHLQGLDLRIAGLVEPDPQESDPVSATVQRIEHKWQAWLSEFVQSHECA